MKLAIMNSKGRFFSMDFLEKYTLAGIEYDFASDLDEFQREYSDFKNYSGVLMHPPLGFHNDWFESVRTRAPNSRIAFATMNLNSTLQRIELSLGIPLLDFNDVEGVREYFG